MCKTFIAEHNMRRATKYWDNFKSTSTPPWCRTELEQSQQKYEMKIWKNQPSYKHVCQLFLTYI